MRGLVDETFRHRIAWTHIDTDPADFLDQLGTLVDVFKVLLWAEM
jgi:hypothetical protein